MKGKMLELVWRSGLLFTISVTLVAGFWFHQTFYQIGLYALLLVGGLATLFVMVAGHVAFTGDFPKRRSVGTIGVTFEEGQHITARSATLLALPPETARELKAGTVVIAKYVHASTPLARLAIQESYRRLLGDISDDEFHGLGYQSKERFRTVVEKYGKWNPNDIATLARFKVLEEKA